MATRVPAVIKVLVVLVAALVPLWLAVVPVNDDAMRPGLQAGDWLLVNRQAYGLRLPGLTDSVWSWAQPDRGDVVTFHMPAAAHRSEPLRVIGLPGDRVLYRDGQLLVNGRPLASDSRRVTFETGARGVYQVQAAQAPVFDPLRLAQWFETGQVNFPENCQYDMEGLRQFACRVPAGHYFLLGDNRPHSHDSRYWGFVAHGRLGGRVLAHL